MWSLGKCRYSRDLDVPSDWKQKLRPYFTVLCKTRTMPSHQIMPNGSRLQERVIVSHVDLEAFISIQTSVEEIIVLFSNDLHLFSNDSRFDYCNSLLLLLNRSCRKWIVRLPWSGTSFADILGKLQEFGHQRSARLQNAFMYWIGNHLKLGLSTLIDLCSWTKHLTHSKRKIPLHIGKAVCLWRRPRGFSIWQVLSLFHNKKMSPS